MEHLKAFTDQYRHRDLAEVLSAFCADGVDEADLKHLSDRYIPAKVPRHISKLFTRYK